MRSKIDARPRTGRSWLVSLTGVCFLFGGLLAFGLRSAETARENNVRSAVGLEEEQRKVQEMRSQLTKEAADRKQLLARMEAFKKQVANGQLMSKAQAAKFNMELKRLQVASGLTTVMGPGVVIRLSDNPEAAKEDAVGPFLPGIVHDFDLLQVVNELRAAKADAIAINGTRITGYTPIRCVGPVIYINWEPAAAPFKIEAVGDSDTLMSALKMPNGIVDNLKNQTLGVRIVRVGNLRLPPTPGVPRLRVAKSG